MANRYLLSLAFRNLMENNCKYSPDRTSYVVIQTRGGVSITFADNGIGMSAIDQREIFRMFYRGSNQAEKGHGIGMALVQRVLSVHHATIDIVSKEGYGTKFIVRLATNHSE